MTPLKITTAISPYGEYNLVTTLPMTVVQVLLDTHSPDMHQLALSSLVNLKGVETFGTNNCLRVVKSDNEDFELFWNPAKIEDCLDVVYRLQKALFFSNPEATEKEGSDDVWISAFATPGLVRANFSDSIWDALEDSENGKRICKFSNSYMRKYWEGKSNESLDKKLVRLFTGNDGLNLQISLPGLHERTTYGSRKQQVVHCGNWQISCHNTDRTEHAVAHLIGLCSVEKAIRTLFL